MDSERRLSDSNRFHAQSVLETVRQLDVQLHQGLSTTAVTDRLRRHGYNELPIVEKVPLWRRFAAQFMDFVVLLLVAAS